MDDGQGIDEYFDYFDLPGAGAAAATSAASLLRALAAPMPLSRRLAAPLFFDGAVRGSMSACDSPARLGDWVKAVPSARRRGGCMVRLAGRFASVDSRVLEKWKHRNVEDS